MGDVVERRVNPSEEASPTPPPATGTMGTIGTRQSDHAPFFASRKLAFASAYISPFVRAIN